MDDHFDEIVRKRYTQIKRLAFLLFGSLIAMLGLCFAADLPLEKISFEFVLVLIISFVIISASGIVSSRLHKVKWIKTALIGRDADILNEKKLKRASGVFYFFFLATFVSWFSFGTLGLVGSIFCGGKIWLAIFGIIGIAMMVITWSKKNDLINFLKAE